MLGTARTYIEGIITDFYRFCRTYKKGPEGGVMSVLTGAIKKTWTNWMP
jgi:hypothetical protein